MQTDLPSMAREFRARDGALLEEGWLAYICTSIYLSIYLYMCIKIVMYKSLFHVYVCTHICIYTCICTSHIYIWWRVYVPVVDTLMTAPSAR
jgi:hypothetical protein